MENTGIIILAAGNSSRLGKPKQLVLYGDQTLIQHAVNAALDTPAQQVILVLGANSTTIKPTIKQTNLTIIENKDWQQGMASSIRAGVSALVKSAPSIEGVIIMVCDQPFVSSSILSQLIEKHKATGKSMIASEYEGTQGTPAFFHKSQFSKLLALFGDSGAKKLIKKYPDLVETIPFPEGKIDIDVPEDVEKLNA